MTEATTPIPTLAPALRLLEGTYVGVVYGEEVNEGGEEILVEDGDIDINFEDIDIDVEDIEDDIMLLLLPNIAEDDVVRFDAACTVKHSGAGAQKVSSPGSM